MKDRQKIKVLDSMLKLSSSKRAHESFNPYKDMVVYCNDRFYATDSVLMVRFDVNGCYQSLERDELFKVDSWVSFGGAFQPKMGEPLAKGKVETLEKFIREGGDYEQGLTFDPKVLKRALDFFSLAGMKATINMRERNILLSRTDGDVRLDIVAMPVMSWRLP